MSVRALLLVAALAGAPGMVAAQLPMVEFPVPTAQSGLTGITAGPDGNVWFVELTANQIGRITPAGTITEFPVPSCCVLSEITAGPDGNIWFTEGLGSVYKIGRITPAGTVTEFPVPGSNFGGITAGPDGNVWFTVRNGSYVGRITPVGAVTTFPVRSPGSPGGITAGPDGNLWFADSSLDYVGRITPAGIVTEFPAPNPSDLAVGADGNLWFTQPVPSSKIFRMTLSGIVTDFQSPSYLAVDAIAAGPDGNLWFVEPDVHFFRTQPPSRPNRIGRITPAGSFDQFSIPTHESGPQRITAGPDGNLWFTEWRANKIGRAIVAPMITQVAPSTGRQRQANLTVTISGQMTHFVEGTTTAGFGAGITVSGVTVQSSTQATAYITIAENAALGPRSVTLTTGGEVATWTGGFRVIPFTLTAGDFDLDEKSDVMVFRPSNGTWYVRNSSTGAMSSTIWGGPDDVTTQADYDGDGRTDIAVFRPSNGVWYVRNSSTGLDEGRLWGGIGDVPVPADYDADGRADIAVFRPSNGTWYIRSSMTGVMTTVVWGGEADVAIPGDYDADGRTDIAVFRSSNGIWYIRNSSTGFEAWLWGEPEDLPVPGDYDGDGRTDLAVFRPSNGTWYVRSSSTGLMTVVVWGYPTDIPILKRP